MKFFIFFQLKYKIFFKYLKKKKKILNRCIKPTKILEFIMYPLAFPTAKFLDWLLGVHGSKRFGKSDLRTLIELHESNDN
jgi:CBS domain containing-hemolysin-like protein